MAQKSKNIVAKGCEGVISRSINPPRYNPPLRVWPGDIVFVGNRLMRIVVTRLVRNTTYATVGQSPKAVWEGINVRTGKTLRFKKSTIRYKSPMSPLEPTIIPRAQAIGLHDKCGGVVYFSRTRRIGDRYCDRCRADGRFGRPRPVLDSEVNPIGRK
jgi:hypothetical protein